MTFEELAGALSGLHAYDDGFTDSGIHDEVLRRRVREHLNGLPDPERRRTLGRLARELYLVDDALAQGFGLEDVVNFAEWLEDAMEVTYICVS